MAFEQVIVRMPNGQDYGPVDMPTLVQWHQEGRLPRDAVVIDAASGEQRPVAAFLALVVPPPPMAPSGMTTPGRPAPSGFDRLIPARNPKALVAYYCAIFGLIPCFTVVLGPLSLILGILGARDAAQLEVGSGHAWVGIILGGLETIALLALAVLAAVGLISS